MEDTLEAEELLALALHELGDGYACPAADYLGDLLLGDLIAQEGIRGIALLGGVFLVLELFLELGQLAVAKLCQLIEVVGSFGFFDLGAAGLDLLAELLHL